MPVTKRKTAAKSSAASPVSAAASKPKLSKKLFTRKNMIVFGLIILALVLWWAKNYFIVATVNGQPISRFELNSRLETQFADTVIEQLVNERLLLGAARQKGIFITGENIDARIKELEKSLEGQMTLEQAVGLQGMTPESFRRQMELQLSIEKIFEGQSSVSASEIEKYIEENRSLFPEASDEAKLKTDVEGFLKQQKIGTLYEDWFNKIKEEAKIEKNI